MLAAARTAAEATARHAECAKRSRDLATALAAATTALEAARTAAGFDRESLHRMLSAEPGRVDALATELDRLDRAVDRARTRISERRRLVDDHAIVRPRPADPSRLAQVELDAARVPNLAAAVVAAERRAAQLDATLAADVDARRRRAARSTSLRPPSAPPRSIASSAT